MTTTTSELVDRWLRLWNGELGLADDLIDPGFHLHGAMTTGADITGPDGLAGWVAQFRAPFSALTFAVEVGPIAQDDLIALRWTVAGVYAGGFPGASAAPGTPVALTGTDILRVAGGRFTEYWVNADLTTLAATLEVAAP